MARYRRQTSGEAVPSGGHQRWPSRRTAVRALQREARATGTAARVRRFTRPTLWKLARKAGTLGIFAFAGFLTFAAMPAVFSLWSEELSVGGTVETGEFPEEGAWFGYSCNTIPEKDESVSWSLQPDPSDPLALDVSLTNGYTGWALYCEIHLANNDDEPLQIVDVLVDSSPSGAVSVEWRQDPEHPEKVMDPCPSEPAWPTKPKDVKPSDCRQEVQFLITFETVVSPVTVSFTAVLDDPGGLVNTGTSWSLDSLTVDAAESTDDGTIDSQSVVVEETVTEEPTPEPTATPTDVAPTATPVDEPAEVVTETSSEAREDGPSETPTDASD